LLAIRDMVGETTGRLRRNNSYTRSSDFFLFLFCCPTLLESNLRDICRPRLFSSSSCPLLSSWILSLLFYSLVHSLSISPYTAFLLCSQVHNLSVFLTSGCWNIPPSLRSGLGRRTIPDSEFRRRPERDGITLRIIVSSTTRLLIFFLVLTLAPTPGP
jgi:hypothetical protein